MAPVKRTDAEGVANEGVLSVEAEAESWRQMDELERGRLLVQLCEAAAMIERGRRLSVLPESQPAPWPESTWEFQRKWTANVQ